MATTKFETITVSNAGTGTVDFGSNVINAGATVQGFSVEFGGDHHFKKMEVKALITSVSGSKVTLTAVCTVEDDSGHKATGSVNILVIAECES